MGKLIDLETGKVTEDRDALWCPKCFGWKIVKMDCKLCPDCRHRLERHDR